MQVSARILGQEYGLTSEEMNRVLVKLGYLIGTPGDYSLTEKAMEFAKEKDFHRGTGGYAHYNRYWTTRTFDDSIKEQLSVTPELIREVREELAATRTARLAEQAAARAEANAAFLAKQAAEKAAKEAEERTAKETEKFIENCKKAGTTVLIIGGGATLIYGIYKTVPKVKAWAQKKRDKKLEDIQKEEEKAKEM